MFLILLFVLLLIAAFVVPRFIKDTKTREHGIDYDPPSPTGEGYEAETQWERTRREIPRYSNKSMRWLRTIVTAVCVVTAIVVLVSTSIVIVDSDKVGHLKRIYGKSLPDGRVIAMPGEKGPQADILGPGFYFKFFIRVIYDIDQLAVVEIPENKYGLLTARDGRPLGTEQYLANAWPEDESDLMSNAIYFMGGGDKKTKEPRGQKGTQLTVLKPGKYRLNRYLFDVSLGNALDVPEGYVAVIKSNVQENEECSPIEVTSESNLAVPLVPRGCKGVWAEPLYPGKYYLNEMAYKSTLISTRVETWAYKGGYDRRTITLDVDQEGNITQESDTKFIAIPENAADGAISCRVEGWVVPQEMRILMQIVPEMAPYVVASVGGVEEAENKIVTPAARSVVRTVIGRAVKIAGQGTSAVASADSMSAEEKAMVLGTRVLDLIERRAELEDEIEGVLGPESLKAYVTLKEVRLAEPVIPPELMLARLRAQLADQLIAAYRKETKAQDERKLVKESQARADKQADLVASQIAVDIADQHKLELQKLGEGEKLRLIEVAKGQKAQVAVLGQDRVMQLEMLQKALDAAVENSDIVKVPYVNVAGNGAGLEGAAAVLGSSSLVQGLIQAQNTGAKTVVEPTNNNNDEE